MWRAQSSRFAVCSGGTVSGRGEAPGGSLYPYPNFADQQHQSPLHLQGMLCVPYAGLSKQRPVHEVLALYVAGASEPCTFLKLSGYSLKGKSGVQHILKRLAAAPAIREVLKAPDQRTTLGAWAEALAAAKSCIPTPQPRFTNGRVVSELDAPLKKSCCRCHCFLLRLSRNPCNMARMHKATVTDPTACLFLGMASAPMLMALRWGAAIQKHACHLVPLGIHVLPLQPMPVVPC